MKLPVFKKNKMPIQKKIVSQPWNILMINAQKDLGNNKSIESGPRGHYSWHIKSQMFVACPWSLMLLKLIVDVLLTSSLVSC